MLKTPPLLTDSLTTPALTIQPTCSLQLCGSHAQLGAHSYCSCQGQGSLDSHQARHPHHAIGCEAACGVLHWLQWSRNASISHGKPGSAWHASICCNAGVQLWKSFGLRAELQRCDIIAVSVHAKQCKVPNWPYAALCIPVISSCQQALHDVSQLLADSTYNMQNHCSRYFSMVSCIHCWLFRAPHLDLLLQHCQLIPWRAHGKWSLCPTPQLLYHL